MGNHFNAGPGPAQDELSVRRLSGPSGAIQFVPTVERILYGAGTAEHQLGLELDRLDCKRVLLLTPRSLESHEVTARARKTLAKRLAERFTVRRHVKIPPQMSFETPPSKATGGYGSNGRGTEAGNFSVNRSGVGGGTDASVVSRK
jgi:hypothetical protein